MFIDHIFKPHIFIIKLALQLPDSSSKPHLYQVNLLSENYNLITELCTCLLKGTRLFIEYVLQLAL